MKKSAFTIMEILLAMAIVGVIAGATMNSIKNITANKVKTAFQNNFSHLQRTVDTIISDETLYPAIYWENQYDSAGKKRKVSIYCGPSAEDELNANGDTIQNPNKFPMAFENLTGGVLYSSTINANTAAVGRVFETKNGSYWMVRKNVMACMMLDTTDISQADFIFVFDVDGINQGSNCPYTGTDFTTINTGCTNPDTFKFGLTTNTKIIFDNKAYYNGKNLETYMKENNFINQKF